MADTNQKLPENLATYWRRVGPLLEQIRKQELREFNYEENWHIVDALLEIGVQFAGPRTTSGLVEMQRWFDKARR